MLEDVTIRKAVEFAVKTEEMGNVFYTKMSKKFAEKDKEISEIFALLAKDEVAHRNQFKALLERIPEDPNVSNKAEELALLKIMSRSEFFMGEDGIYRHLEKIETRDDALERAVRLEKDTLGYFHALKDVLGNEDVLDAIIKIEKGHLVKLMEYMITGAKMRGLGDNYPE
jgi:rubrerythrin